MASGAIAIPGAGQGAHSHNSDLPTGSMSPNENSDGVARSCPIPIPNGGSQPASSSKGDPDTSRHQRLARKAESARAARLRHKQYVSEMHEQMLLLNARVRELERANASSEEAATARVMALIKAALTPDQAVQLTQWLKAAGPVSAVNGDLATAFEQCRLEDALHLPASAGAQLSASLPAALSAGLSPTGNSSASPILTARPGGRGAGSGTPYGTAGPAGSLPMGGLGSGASAGGPFRGRHGSQPIAISGSGGGRRHSVSIPVSLSGDNSHHGLGLPMESDEDARASFAGPLSGGGGALSRSWDDIESAQAILSLNGSTPPPHANSYHVQSMDLQFE
mmetsp:Transcript_2453/g.6992  ORF Transcript_2453/g.6992 Transcript_2453/m.6992 type:complete len:337 (+) Transcript_2453:122-1132(+)